MGLCKDPRLTFLNDLGYNVVRLPRQGIRPLGVIGQDHKSRLWLGTLDQIWQSETKAPAPGPPSPMGGIKGQKTSDMKLSFGLEILANVLGGMLGTKAPSLDFAYENARSVQFEFGDVRAVGIDPFAIGSFLASGDLKPSPVVKRYFTGEDDVEALVICEVLEARSIGVVARRDAATEVAVEVPRIQAALGAKVGVTARNQSSTDVQYEATEFLVFGFKALGIGISNGEWQVYGVEADQGHAFAVGETPRGAVDRDRLVDIAFPAAGV
jgi:hypothetical protein